MNISRFYLLLLLMFTGFFITTVVFFIKFRNSRLTIKYVVFSVILLLLIICIASIVASKGTVTASKSDLIVKKINQGAFILAQNRSPVEKDGEYLTFTFFNSTKGLSEIGSMDDMVKLECDDRLLIFSKEVKLQLDANYKCQILVDGKSIVDLNNPRSCVWIKNKARVEKTISEIVSKYVELCVKSSEIKDGVLSLNCEGYEIVKNEENLKLFLLEPCGNTSDSKYEMFLKRLFSDYTGDPEFICQKEGEDDRSIPGQKENFWINTHHGKLAICLLSMFNPYERLNRRKLCQSEQSTFDKQIGCLLNYIQENGITSDESSFNNLLGFIKECFCTYQVIGEDYSLSNGGLRLSDIMLRDLKREDDICRYIFAIACCNNDDPNYTKTNNFIKDLLVLTGYEDLPRKAAYITTCKDFERYSSLYSEKRNQEVDLFYEDMKIDDVLKELSIDNDQKYTGEELIKHAREYLIKRYISQIELSLSEKKDFSLEVGSAEGIVLTSRRNEIANVIEIDNTVHSSTAITRT